LAEIAKLGVIISAANIVRRIHYSASDIVIGRLGSPTEVGIFSRGMGFIDFVSQIVLDGVNGVAQPYMSDLKRRGEDIVAAYVKSTALLLSLVWPILAVAGLAALSAIRLLFGDQWDQSAPIASVLAFWMMIKVVSFFSPPLFIAVSHEDVMFRRDIASFTILAVCLVFAYPYGLQAMGGAFLASGLIEMVITLWLLRRYLKLSIRTLVTALTKPLIVTVVCYVAALCLDLVYPFAHATPLVVLALLAVVVTPTWLLACKFLNLTIYFEVVRLVQPLLRRFAK
jgi:O-antigen/teichoic acid export membrane protein